VIVRDALAAFEAVAPMFQNAPGLIRRYFCYPGFLAALPLVDWAERFERGDCGRGALQADAAQRMHQHLGR
jgi:hypothetical protein